MDMEGYFRFALSLMLVIGLILLAAGVLKRYGNSGFRGFGSVRRTDRRLQVIETLAIDPRRRLVLVKRDDVEHLLLLGGTTDTVVERAIARPAGAEGASAAPAPALVLGAPAGERGDVSRT